MLPEAGDSLLHYRLVEKIGEGGMGVVWKAHDTTLNRNVAIKLLPELCTGDAERLARFEREAKLLASLNHPNIAGIYGIHRDEASADSAPFLAMELVEGEELAERLSRGALPRDEALAVALQIAQALEAAHESGVIHRDLKPANVKLTTEKGVKVLDFGLAKALSPEASGGPGSPTMSPTLTSAGTVAGVILGTASYMSPEQAKGEQVDRRADIWSFGVVLFEMLSGRRLFQAPSISETLAAVILTEVDWSALPANTPPRIRRLLERCLQRDPRSRLRDIGDARIAIEEAQRAPDEVERPVTDRRPTVLTWISWAIAAAALVGLGWLWLTGGRATEPAPVMRFTMSIADDQMMLPTPLPALAISPDGTRVAYAGLEDNEPVIFLRYIHQREAVPLKGTEGAESPFFSPDGEWIGFMADGKLKKISILGGPPSTLCDAPRLRGASWGRDGTIVFAPNRSGGLMRVSEAGGEPQRLSPEAAEDDLGAPSDRWPQMLPGQRTVIFTATENNSEYENAEIVALSLEDGTRKTLIRGGTYGRFVPPGFLVYSRDDTLFASRFDPKRLEVTGPPVPVLEGLAGAPLWGSTQIAFSHSGTLLYLTRGGAFDQETLVWLDREGREEVASSHVNNYRSASLSPGGDRVAVDIESSPDGGVDVWILELERDALTRLTFHERWDLAPIWSPDGEWIVFTSTRDDSNLNLYRKRANGTGEVERLTVASDAQYAWSWSPDGAVIAFEQRDGDDLMLYRPGSDPEVEVLLATPFQERIPRISPDGRWVAYRSNASGVDEIYVGPLSGGGEHVKVSPDGGAAPRWNPAADELLYRSLANKIMAVSFTVEDGRFRPGLPRELFDYPRPPYSGRFDVSPDGRRILCYRNVEGGSRTRIEPAVVVNWIAELEAKVPATR